MFFCKMNIMSTYQIYPPFIPCKVKDCNRDNYVFNSDGAKGPGYYLKSSDDSTDKERLNLLGLLDQECSRPDGSLQKIKDLIENKRVKPEKHHIISSTINDRYDIVELLLVYIKNTYEINSKQMIIELSRNSRERMYSRPIPIVIGPKYKKFITSYENEENKTNKPLIKLQDDLKKQKEANQET